MYILSFDRNFYEGIKGIMDSGRRQMTALAKLTEAVQHAYRKRNDNRYIEAPTEVGSCNVWQGNTATLEAKRIGILCC
jgi:hypothetical protein